MNYWEHHGWMFLFGLYFFPRLTLWFFTPNFVFLWYHWLGSILTPRIMIAIYAIIMYSVHNPILVCISVLCAIQELWEILIKMTTALK